MGNSVNHTDWEMQRERLSAYLDGEATPAERYALDAHLSDCAQCQRELAELRQTRELVRALPAPPLPRAFTLPISPTEAPGVSRVGRLLYPRWTRPAQALGGVAAVIGLGLLVSMSLPHPSSQMSGAASSASYSSDHSASTAPSPTHAQGVIALTPAPTTPSATASAAGNVTYAPAQPSAPTASPFAPVTGGLLLVGGAAVMTAGSVSRRRARRAARSTAPGSSERAS